MHAMETISFVLFTSILITVLNQRFFKLQTTVAVMSATLTLSLLVTIMAPLLGKDFTSNINKLIQDIDFSTFLIDDMLGYLLFAGALSIKHSAFKNAFREIFTLATISTIISTALITVACYALFGALATWLNPALSLDWLSCFLFAALISPTDPIAVLGTFKSMKAPEAISVKMAGESLFNDGVGIVIFTVAFHFAHHHETHSGPIAALYLFIQQAIGGLCFGALLGLFMQQLIRFTNGIKLHILITIATVTAGYCLAQNLHISGPLAMVVAGMTINFNHRYYALNANSRVALHNFWEIIDELLNIILFCLLGAEILILNYSLASALITVLIIPLVLASRWLSISLPFSILGLRRKQPKHTIEILVWGGLRGGLAVALALSLNIPHRDIILLMTYAVVAFSVLVQGTSIPTLVRKRYGAQ